MATLAPNRQLRDPRIVSPEIKVVFPSQHAEKDLQVSNESTVKPTPQILPAVSAPDPASVTVPETVKESVIVSTKTATQTVTETPAPAKTSTWKEALKDHLHLFIMVALISIAVGIFIGKKM